MYAPSVSYAEGKSRGFGSAPAFTALVLSGWLGFVVTGCRRPDTTVPPPSRSDLITAATARPSDKTLAAKYDRSCRSCHAVLGLRAPLTGHKLGWAPHLAKGKEQLLISMKEGFRAMPPKGLCLECTDEDLMALMVFMSGQGE